MKDFNILSYVGRSLWAITPEKMAEMVPALIRHAKGDKLSAEELQAFVGRNEQPSAPNKRGVVAVIPVRGVIAHRMNALEDSSGGVSCEKISAMIDMVAADPNIGTIVYDVDTPGGTVSGLQELSAKMFALRGMKKQIAMIQGMCCSAGYWLMANCDEIHISPSSEAGSIGVFAAHKDLSEALAKEGIKITLIKAGKYKFENNPFEPLSDEAEAFIQKNVDEAYGEFIKTVARGRGVTVSDVKAGFGEGRSLKAKDAKAAGLVDKIGTMDDLLGKLTGRSSNAGARAEEADAAVAAGDEAVNEALMAGDISINDLRAARERLEQF